MLKWMECDASKFHLLITPVRKLAACLTIGKVFSLLFIKGSIIKTSLDIYFKSILKLEPPFIVFGIAQRAS